MPSVGAVTSNLNATVKSGAYTAAANDLVLVDATTGPVTITVPAAPLVNTLIAVKKIDTSGNLVTVVPASGFIDSDTSVGLYSVGSTVTLQYDGSRWRLVSTGVTNIANPGSILPAGGTAGQILTKSSASSYDATWAPVANDLPTGGAAGQVLTKNTGSNYDASWASAAAYSGAVPPWRPGRMHISPMTTVGVSFSASQNTLQLWPVQIPNACTIGKIGLIVNTMSTSSLYRTSIYADNPAATSSGPSTLLGSLVTSAAATGFVQSASAWNYTFTAPTTVWMGLQINAAASTTLVGSQSDPMSFLPGATGPFSSGTSLFTALQASTIAYSTALPTDLSATALSQNGSSRPLFIFQVTA